MITENYVSFEIAKLLKENGFDENTPVNYFVGDDKPRGCMVGEMIYHKRIEEDTHLIACPTLQMAMKWLRETHNIDISVVPHSHKENKAFEYEFVYWNGGEYHVPYDEKHPIYHEFFGKTWKKYEEACEAAIKYCLENLI